MSSISHAYREEAYSFPVLPGNMQRSDVQRLMRRVAPAIGMNDGQLTVMLAMIDETRPSDWVDPTIEPVCFAMQSNIAALTGKDERTVRRVEAVLEGAFGFIRKDVAMNGRRCRFRRSDGSEYRQGIVFSPLIEAMPRLIELEADLHSGRIDRSILKQKISAAKRLVKSKLMDLQPRFPDDSSLREAADTFLSWPTRFYASVSVDELHEHLTEVSEVLDKLVAFSQSKQKMSGRADTDALQYIQDTTQDTSVFCNGIVDMRAARKRADVDQLTAQPNGCAVSKVRNDRDPQPADKTDLGDHLTPMRLFYLCTEEMQLQVQISQGDRLYPDERDFTNGAIDRLQPLGIHPSAFNDATDQMGSMAASLCIMIIDRNRFHPATPIKSPGGVLRAMTRRHASGQLNLNRSIFGLFQRKHGS
ncbi:replication initiation protein RepC [Tritonibacter scottomollicae]|uniref:Replication initiation protein RepC n=1 Tax=Tritonibacter scottomollicae TaxID=483013 RepID=A0A2T1AAN7_TRISK|nr:replication initiation protein RepC [Tritonibacter scottomollicae]PRZ45577.1 replication initiation protein RepC [Tritonibacter scottomollicae]